MTKAMTYDPLDTELAGGEWVSRGLTRVWIASDPVEESCAFDDPTPIECACGGPKSAAAKVCMPCHRAAIAIARKPRPSKKPVGVSDGPDCGSLIGYRSHRKRGTTTCRPCRDAAKTEIAERRQRKADRRLNSRTCECGSTKDARSKRCQPCAITNRPRFEMKVAR